VSLVREHAKALANRFIRGVGSRHSERNQLAAMSLILFSYFSRKKPVYLSLYPRAETRERSSISSLNCRHHDKSRLKVAPIASNAQST
jgi:hypothetical protein